MTFIELSEVLGNLGEFVGSIAVLATLIYLAVQVRHSKELLERNEKIALSQVYQGRTEMRLASYRLTSESEMAGVRAKVFERFGDFADYEKSMQKVTELNSVEKQQFASLLSHNLHAMDNTLYQKSLGLIDEQMYQAARNHALNIYEIADYCGASIPPAIKDLHEQVRHNR